MTCRALWNTTCDELFDPDVLPEIDFIYSTKESEIKMLNVSSVMEITPKIIEEKFGLSVSAVLCGCTQTVPQQRMQSISVTFTNRVEAEMVFA